MVLRETNKLSKFTYPSLVFDLPCLYLAITFCIVHRKDKNWSFSFLENNTPSLPSHVYWLKPSLECINPLHVVRNVLYVVSTLPHTINIPPMLRVQGLKNILNIFLKIHFWLLFFLNLLSERPSQTLLLHRTAPRLTNDFLS